MCRICRSKDHLSTDCPLGCGNREFDTDNLYKPFPKIGTNWCERSFHHHYSECCHCGSTKHTHDMCFYTMATACTACGLRNHSSYKCRKKCKDKNCGRSVPHHIARCCFCDSPYHKTSECTNKMYENGCKICGLYTHSSKLCEHVCDDCETHDERLSCPYV
jgi:hypothetical protein